MPFSELHRMAKGKLESTPTKMANTSADPTFGTDNEFAELVWENGQIMVQGQTSRTRKSNTGNSFQTHTPKVQEKDRDVGMSKTGRFGTIDSVLNDFSSSEPSGPIGLGQDDEMVPWLNYPFDDNLPHDYSEFMNEFNGDNLNSISVHNHPVPNGKDTSYGQTDRNSDMVPLHGGARSEQRNVPKVVGEGPEPFRLGSGWFGSSMLNQNQSSIPSQRSTISDFTRSNTNNTQQTLCENSSVTPASITDLPNIMLEKQDPGARRSTGQFNNNMGLTNFSHFSRPATLSKSNLQSMKVSASPDKLRNSEKPTAEVISNPVESTVIESTSGSRSVVGFNGQSVLMPGKMDVRPSHGKPPKEPISTEHSEAICSENVFRNTRSTDQSLGQTSSFAASATIGIQESERDLEPVVGSSSMCSGSSAGGTSNEPKETLKRKSREADESEYQSEDAEEESVGVRKPANARGGTGARRSRAAEVHNLSERRRRDRINEKMRALQELIPNCNKVDKASMLDEAIEYLKTLQLQVQIMSMGAGMYMPPIMLPTGMHGPHFSPMGVGMGMGMGMGMGFGMGMLDMGGGRPMMMSPMHGMQFSRSPISGSTSLPMMGGSNVQMLGVPGQGLPMSMPRAPYVPLPEGFSARPVSLPDISGPTALLEDPNPVMPSSSKGLTQNKNSQMMTKTNGKCSQNQPNMQATKEGLEQSAAVQRNDPALNDSCDGDINSAGGNENFN